MNEERVIHLPGGEWTPRPEGLWQPPLTVPTVADLVAAMDERVAGLSMAKKRLALALQTHLLCGLEGIEDRQPNIIIVGPTGGGKSILTQTACEVIGLPYIDVNATEYSETGFVGKDLSQMLLRFNDPRWRGEGKAEDIVPLVERFGVAIVDEFDKLAFKANLRERQVEKKLQYEMLRFAEGVVTTVRETDEEVGYPFDTRNILFIAVGAFQSLGSLPVDDPQKVEAQHIVQYGFIEELVGRFSSVIGLPHLQQDALVRVLRERFLPWYETILERQGIFLDFREDGMRAMADVVIHEKIGARGLQGLLEKVLSRPRIEARAGQTIMVGYDQVPGGGVVVD